MSNVQHLYANLKAKIRTSPERAGESSYFSVNKSVFQGETVSPKLFFLFIEDVVAVLNKAGISAIKIEQAEINILLYADDMVLLAYNVFELQSKIDVLKKHLSENDLIVNLNKTKVIIFRAGNSKICKPKVFWGENEIEIHMYV
jgi:hypothetical protein